MSLLEISNLILSCSSSWYLECSIILTCLSFSSLSACNFRISFSCKTFNWLSLPFYSYLLLRLSRKIFFSRSRVLIRSLNSLSFSFEETLSLCKSCLLCSLIKCISVILASITFSSWLYCSLAALRSCSKIRLLLSLWWYCYWISSFFWSIKFLRLSICSLK